MILQELCNLYDRLEADPDSDIAPFGSVVQGVAFAVVIDESGKLIDIQDMRRHDNNKSYNRQMVLPGKAKPSGAGINPSLHCWDRTDYMLGYVNLAEEKPSDRDKKSKRAEKAYDAFKIAMQQKEEDLNHPAFSAFCRFLESWEPTQAEQYQVLKEVSGMYGVVRLQGSEEYLHQLPGLQKGEGSDSEMHCRCLVTGEASPIARTHTIKIKGVPGAQSAGAAVISFNLDAFESYGHSQSYNAPVSEEAAFKYATALNVLLDRDSSRKIQIGDTTCVFWADEPSEGEELFFFGLSGGATDSDREQALKATFGSLVQGQAQVPDGDTGFHVLGLSPNASRLSVRFWLNSSLGEMLEMVLQHQREMTIIRSPKDSEFVPTWLILLQTVREKKDIPPLLGGALLRAVLTGNRYPEALLAAVIRRIRADREINHPRAAILKAILIRNYHKEELTMLNPDRPETAYQLGRLFAALEKAQEDAISGINASIKDRYFGAASATPASVFPRLIRMNQHHVGKLEGGRKVNTERRIQSICGNINNFPAHLGLADQGLFSLGYYHQRQDFFKKKPTDGEETKTEK